MPQERPRTRRHMRLLALASALAGGTLLVGASCAMTRPRAQTVAIRAFQYQPAAVTVQVGDTVTWTNDDLVPHTATTAGKAFDSGSIGSAESWRYVATQKGTHEYVCTFHPTMKGTLVVR